MRIQSVTVRNYRIHRELTVDFDAAATLVGGPNESGKSTLIEALHRALFLKAKAGGEARRLMCSTRHGGHPEVEVRFEVGGKSYLLHKKFSGAGGTALLAEVGGETWRGEQAEERLGELTGAGVLGARGDDRLRRQWGHLWVWQGEAGGDPSAHANHQHEALVARLQSQGGAVVLQSALDAKVAERFAGFVAGTFTNAGAARAASDLGQAEAVATRAEEALAAAADTIGRLETAMRECADADQEIRRHEDLMPGLEQELAKVDGQLGTVARLRAKLQVRDLLASQRRSRHQSLVAADAEIVRLGTEIARARESLGPKEVKTAQLEQDLHGRRADSAAAQQAWSTAGNAAAAKRAERELARAWSTLFDRRAAHAALATRHAAVQEQRTNLQRLQRELAALPAITAKDLQRLQSLDQDRSHAAIALDAMAAGIDVLAADVEVRVAGEELGAGDSRTLTEVAEVTVGGGVRLRIRPGGGARLDDARLRRDQATHDLAGLLGRLAAPSVEAAARIVAERARVAGDVGTLEAALQAAGAATLDDELARAALEVANAEAEVHLRQAAVVGATAPADAEAALAWNTGAERDAEAAETAERESAAALAAANQRAQEAEQALTSHRAAIQQEQSALATLEARLSARLGEHGDEPARRAAIARLAARAARADRLVDATRRKLADLQPEMLDADRQRLDVALRSSRAGLDRARQKRAAAMALLRQTGASDPAADLADAKAAADRAAERLRALLLRGRALRRLDELFRDEQRRCADRFTQPLADRMTGYLQCLFGPHARIRVEVADDGRSFQQILVHRPAEGEAETAFDVLSGGAKEQVAAAVRLAIADLLAEDHDGTLPVVFDDAFAYSDPERVKGVQRMLYHAARQGLQVIVLACNPNDYAGLGAATVQLGTPAATAATLQPPAAAVP